MNIKLDIPEKFFEGEERSGYYVSPEMKKVWAVQLDLLAEFSRVCEKHNLKWWMDGGTLLGAARHKGFIPWDDDVDVAMMRKDYKRLLEVANEFKKPYLLHLLRSTEVFAGGAKLYNDDTTMIEPYTVSMMKRGMEINFPQGIFIDIFPLDNLPDNESEMKKVCAEFHSLALPVSTKVYNRLIDLTDHYGYYRGTRKFWKRLVRSVLHYSLSIVNPFLGNLKAGLRRKRAESIEIFDKALDSLDYTDGKWIAKLVFAHDRNMTRRIWERSWFNDTVQLPFEMLTLPAPSEYAKVLDTFYGNWHEYIIRQKHADFYDTEHPYTYYTQEGHIPE